MEIVVKNGGPRVAPRAAGSTVPAGGRWVIYFETRCSEERRTWARRSEREDTPLSHHQFTRTAAAVRRLVVGKEDARIICVRANVDPWSVRGDSNSLRRGKNRG